MVRLSLVRLGLVKLGLVRLGLVRLGSIQFLLNLASFVVEVLLLKIPVPLQESLLPPALLVYALRLAPASYGPQEDAALYGSNK